MDEFNIIEVFFLTKIKIEIENIDDSMVCFAKFFNGNSQRINYILKSQRVHDRQNLAANCHISRNRERK